MKEITKDSFFQMNPLKGYSRSQQREAMQICEITDAHITVRCEGGNMTLPYDHFQMIEKHNLNQYSVITLSEYFEDNRTKTNTTLEKLAKEYAKNISNNSTYQNYIEKAFIEGYNSNKTYQKAIELIEYFVKRVQEGTIISKTTYRLYKDFLNSLNKNTDEK